MCVVNHDSIQQNILAGKKTLHNYNKALEIALTMETAEQRTKILKARDLQFKVIILQPYFVESPHESNTSRNES